MKITTEMAAHIAALSRLKLSEEEAGRMAGELEQILSYMDVLDGLDTSGAEPMSHIVPLKNVLREDETAPSMDRSLQKRPFYAMDDPRTPGAP